MIKQLDNSLSIYMRDRDLIVKNDFSLHSLIIN